MKESNPLLFNVIQIKAKVNKDGKSLPAEKTIVASGLSQEKAYEKKAELEKDNNELIMDGEMIVSCIRDIRGEKDEAKVKADRSAIEQGSNSQALGQAMADAKKEISELKASIAKLSTSKEKVA